MAQRRNDKITTPPSPLEPRSLVSGFTLKFGRRVASGRAKLGPGGCVQDVENGCIRYLVVPSELAVEPQDTAGHLQPPHAVWRFLDGRR